MNMNLDKMTHEQYLEHPAISRSYIWESLKRSVLHAEYGKKSSSKSKDLGTAFHTLVLDGEETFKKQYWVKDLDMRTKESKAIAEEAEQKGILLLKTKDYDKIKAMRDAIFANKFASKLLKRDEGKPEVPVFWTDLVTDLECKCKPDFLRNDGFVVDLKSCNDAGKAFERHAFDYGYHLQAAFYCDGLLCSGILSEIPPFIFVAVESEEPYDVVVYEASPEMMLLGREMYRKGLEKIAKAINKGVIDKTDGYSFEPLKLYPPAYLMKGNNL